MRVILTKDVPALGSMGDVVSVKGGYGRNFLIPRSIALVANESNRSDFEHKKQVIADKKQKLLKKMKSLAHEIEKIKLSVAKQVGEDERIFGSVTTAEISALLQEKGHEIHKKDISFPEEIKKLGTFSAQIKLHSEVNAKIKVKVSSANKSE